MEAAITGQKIRSSTSWGDTLAGVLPVLIFAAATTIEGSGISGLGQYMVILFIILLYALPTIGIPLALKAGFPRWTAPYLALAVLDVLLFSPIFFSALLENPLVQILLRAAILVLLVYFVYQIISSIRSKSIQLSRLAESDWSWMLFTAHTLTPWAVMVIFDDVAWGYKTIFMLLCGLVLALGAMLYMRASQTWIGVAYLLGSAALAWLIADTVMKQYWLTHPWGP